jgi:hypothetical protein
VGLLKWPSSNFSLDPHLDFGVQLASKRSTTYKMQRTIPSKNTSYIQCF